jgi:hypothetical protein
VSLVVCTVLGVLLAQPPISTRAGLIYYAEGGISVNGRLLLRFNPMVRVAAGESLAVDAGRVEILLQPQNFLRLADHSNIEMKSDLLSRVEVAVRGAAILDLSVVDAKHAIAVTCGGTVLQVLRPGRYRFDCDRSEMPNSLRVAHGHARLILDGRQLDLTGNQAILLISGAKPRTLHQPPPDTFDEWSDSRSALVASKQRHEKLPVYKPGTAGLIITSSDDHAPPN